MNQNKSLSDLAYYVVADCLRALLPQKWNSFQVHSNGLKFGAYVGAEVRRLW